MLVSTRTQARIRAPRRGVAAVEMAVLLPLLMLLLVIAVDFARIFYYSLTVANCARNGARYASDEVFRSESPYTSVTEAALADASNLDDPSNPPKVTSATFSDGAGNSYARVTVRYQFPLLTNFPGMPSTFTIRRVVQMQVAPGTPGT